MNIVSVKILRGDYTMPAYAKPGDSGMDIRAIKEVVIEGGQTLVVPTGLRLGIPEGFEIQVRPRSGLSLKTKMRVANSPGTIDSSYTGEIGVIIDNISTLPIVIPVGERIAQIVLCPVYHILWDIVNHEDSLGVSERGASGYGSSGTK